MLFTWDDLYERADGAACGEDVLDAKDNARYEIRRLVKALGGPDIEKEECPEDFVNDYCIKFDIQFDKQGHMKRIHFPCDIANIIYNTQQEEYRKQDIIDCAENMFGITDLSDEIIRQMLFHVKEDANSTYNDTIEQAVRKVLEKESEV